MLKVDYSAQFKKDYKRCIKKRFAMQELHEVIKLIAENSKESRKILRQRHNMHTLRGAWKGSQECHIANAADWLVIWSSNNEVAFFQRTGSHDDLFK
jgi:mRNA interferase YafQ